MGSKENRCYAVDNKDYYSPLILDSIAKREKGGTDKGVCPRKVSPGIGEKKGSFACFAKKHLNPKITKLPIEPIKRSTYFSCPRI